MQTARLVFDSELLHCEIALTVHSFRTVPSLPIHSALVVKFSQQTKLEEEFSWVAAMRNELWEHEEQKRIKTISNCFTGHNNQNKGPTRQMITRLNVKFPRRSP